MLLLRVEVPYLFLLRSIPLCKCTIVFFLRFYLFIFRERGKEGRREEEKHQCVVASDMVPTGDQAHNPGMCPDWE